MEKLINLSCFYTLRVYNSIGTFANQIFWVIAEYFLYKRNWSYIELDQLTLTEGETKRMVSEGVVSDIAKNDNL